MLLASGMATHQDFAVVSIRDRQARLAVLMGRAPRHPGSTPLATAERPGDGFRRHQQASRAFRYPSHVISYADHGCLTLPRAAVSRPRPGRFISVMASARGPAGFRDSDADRSPGRWCAVRV